MTNQKIKPIDRIIARNVRHYREQDGISIPALAKKLKITRQQLQKYEDGVNRISASRLFDIAAKLNRPVQWFFKEVPK